jgi:aryl-alcohol dehydrogenase-like predicted oxidoreductase
VRFRKIGGLSVSAVGLGCSNFGRAIDADLSAEVVLAALDAGVNLFDTADSYNGGRGEEFLGRALRGRRDQAVIATKFGRVRPPGAAAGSPPHGIDASAAHVRAAAEASLRRLGTGHIDLYILHVPDPRTPVAETLGALNALVDAGTVREIGCSSADVGYLRAAAAAARENGLRPFVNVQNRYNLLDRERPAERGVLAECTAAGLAFVPFSPLAAGMLSGKYQRGIPPEQGSRLAGPPIAGYGAAALLTEPVFEVTERLSAFAAARGRTLLDLAFAGLLAYPAIASVIAGATSPAQVRANAGTAQWELTPAELAEVGRLSEEGQ